MKKKIKNQFDISFLPETATPAPYNPILGGEADNGKGVRQVIFTACFM